VGLAVSHGSRTQLLEAKISRIQSILMLDYEYTESKIFNLLSTNLLMPVYIPDSRLVDAGFKLNKIIRYEGFKEELYLKYFKPDCNFRKSMNIDEDQFLVVVRPPSMVGNYHDPRSEELLIGAIDYFSKFSNTVCLIVNRTETEKKFILSKIKISENVKFLDKAVDGLQLLFAADVAVSGGGTMNRESALLGTETYSIFTGRRPYLDEYLQQMGRLKFIETCKDFEEISIEKKKKLPFLFSGRNLAEEITAILLEKLRN
jgi:predicted glycosyltransferase